VLPINSFTPDLKAHKSCYYFEMFYTFVNKFKHYLQNDILVPI